MRGEDTKVGEGIKAAMQRLGPILGWTLVTTTVGLILQAIEERLPVAGRIAAWLAGGIPSSRLAGLVAERGLATLPTTAELRQVEAAGASPRLLRVIRSANARSANIGPAIPAGLMKAAGEVCRRQFHAAELEVHEVLASDAQNSALHFALGTIYRQEEKWDEAFDELTLATQLMPEFGENHAALAYLFYRLDDGPNAIAEARTALSIDPENSDAYQYLGLGLYSNYQYRAAVHAYAESLSREPNNTETCHGMGIVLDVVPNHMAADDANVYWKVPELRGRFFDLSSRGANGEGEGDARRGNRARFG